MRRSQLTTLPHKLKNDAIAEALCELRFDCDESESLPEYVIGRLASNELWKEFKKTRLPISEIPTTVRSNDPNLRYQPSIELRDPRAPRIVKIGINIISLHCLDPYCGWTNFENEISSLIDFLFSTLTSVRINRIGLRYINLFDEKHHSVTDITSLDVRVCVADEELTRAVNLNYQVFDKDNLHTMIRVATPEFVSNPVAREFTVLADIDVSTRDRLIETASECKQIINEAHEEEKSHFFSLFTEDMLANLSE